MKDSHRVSEAQSQSRDSGGAADAKPRNPDPESQNPVSSLYLCVSVALLQSEIRNPKSEIGTSICVTLDYELFGDGTGDIQKHILEPTERLLAYCHTTGIKVTVFVEIAELLAFENALKKGRMPKGLASDFSAILTQLKRIVAYGHDIQLHLHPQWIGAEWRNAAWRLPRSSADVHAVSMEAVEATLRDGKTVLEAVGQSANPNYRCCVFRAGSLQFDRSGQLTALLLKLGIRADSSICRGFHRQTRDVDIDYRHLSSIRQPYWLTTDGSVTEAASALTEFPIWGQIQPQWRKLTPLRLWNKLQAGARGWGLGIENLRFKIEEFRLGRNLQSSIGNLQFFPLTPNPQPLIPALSWGLFTRQPLLWDFCLMTPTQLIRAFEAALAFHETPTDFFPLVMIGHTKELLTLKPLSRLHNHIRQHTNADWITLSEALGKQR